MTVLPPCRAQAHFSNYLLPVFHFPSICAGGNLRSCRRILLGKGTNPDGWIRAARTNTDRLTVIGWNEAQRIQQEARGVHGRARKH